MVLGNSKIYTTLGNNCHCIWEVENNDRNTGMGGDALMGEPLTS
jgi:hypothetical protein